MRLPKRDLLSHIIGAIGDSGWGAACLNVPPVHPFRLSVYSLTESFNIRVYIWNLTHGGHGRAEDEYRIQVTGVPQGIVGESGFKTLILGYWPEGGVFAGFDFASHNGPIGYSPSIQIRLGALEAAYVDGFAVCNKGGGEIALAFRPDYFVEYCRQINEIHVLGENASNVQALDAIADDDLAVNEDSIALGTVGRRRTLRKVAASHIQPRSSTNFILRAVL